ncbi:hypothetical protein GYMLUDRAFT_240883 [Collybiopsis luxurians FD-317 M1]|nr:hypothetical protein GYMLUDRAFT_240883 [Collybiopsis luxurians FD-317 M1]
MHDLAGEELPGVHQLPPEILETIFLFCCHDNSVYSSRTEAPFNLFSTCMRWRLIALNLPRLWCTFHVVLAHNACRPALPVLQSWLDRSRTCPLSFSLMYRGLNFFDEEKGFPRNPETMNSVFTPLKILLEHLGRWRNVYFDLSNLPYNMDFSPSSSFQPNSLILHNFSVRTFEPHSIRFRTAPLIPTYMDWISELAQNSPGLRKFASYGGGLISHFSGVNSSYSIPWNHLTTLTLERVSETLALFILQSSSSLIKCTFGGLGHYVDWFPSFNNNNIITGPQLRDEIIARKLTGLSITAGNDIDRFWTTLTAPNLRELEIYMLLDARQWHQGDELLQFLTRSGTVLDSAGLGLGPAVPISTARGPPISRLVLRNVKIHTRLGACVKLLTDTLEELAVIDKTTVDDSFMDLLTFPTGVDPAASSPGSGMESTEEEKSFLCPRLQTLTLQRCISCLDGRTSQMIRSRWYSPALSATSGLDEDGDANMCEGVKDLEHRSEEGDIGNDSSTEAYHIPRRYYGNATSYEPPKPRKLKSVWIEFLNSNHAEDVFLLEEMMREGLGGEVKLKKG